MTRWLNPLLVFLVAIPLLGVLQGCADVEGYDELAGKLSTQDQARLGVFDAVRAYTPIQVVLEQAVMNQSIPPDLKASIKLADAQVTAGIQEYQAAVLAGADNTTALLETLLTRMTAAQTLMLEAIATGVAKGAALSPAVLWIAVSRTDEVPS